MKKLQTLNKEQQTLVEEHLSIIHWAIHHFIKVNESIYGLEYADLYGEGCVLLCKAAITYNSSRGRFASYAQTVVKNGLISYSRIICGKQDRQRLLLDPVCLDNGESFADQLAFEEDWEHIVSGVDADILFRSLKPKYDGITLRGIEAIELKAKGYSGKEIAALFHAPENHVGAWITRAALKLRSDEQVLKLLGKAS